MRLTLRNLLRFLDQTNLRAVERNRLDALVSESKKAANWIKKINRAKGRSDLRSLAFDDPDYPIDTIVAYLDCKLGEESTIDLERSIISREELLAEIASCHAIRESNSNQPKVTIPLELRQVIYDLRLKPDPTAGDLSVSQSKRVPTVKRRLADLPFVDADNAAMAMEKETFNPVGDKVETTVSIDAMYKKAKRRSQLGAALVGLILIAFLAFAFELGRQSGKEEQGSSQAASATQASKKTPDKTKNLDAPPAPEPDNSKEKTDTTADSKSNGTATAADGTDTANSFPMRPEPTEDGNSGKSDSDEVSLASRPDIEFGLKKDSLPERQRQPVATVKNENSVILQRKDKSQPWVRLDDEASILEKTELMVLAGTDAELDLRGNLTVKIVGPARFTIGMNDIASDTEVLKVSHGVFQIEANVADIDLLWERSDRRYRTTLPITPATAIAEFMQFQSPGLDSRVTPPDQIDLFYAQTGRMIINQEESTWRLPESGAMVRVISKNPELAQEPLMGSITLPLPKIRDYASRLKDTVEKNFSEVRTDLPSDQTLYDFLVKLKSDSKQERRFAAISWLSASGEFSFLLDFLNDEKNRNNWRSAIEAVQAAIANHPEYADKVEAYLLENDPQEGDKIYEMLNGYSEKQLAEGADAKLVKFLDSDSLATRVLAIETLRKITDGRSYGYNASADRKSRRRSIDRQWNKLLDREELRYEVPPQIPLPELLPFEQPAEEDGTLQEDGTNNGG